MDDRYIEQEPQQRFEKRTKSALNTHPKLILALIGLAILGGVLYFSNFTEAFMAGFEGHGGLPSCGSPHGQSDAKSALENAPFAKTLHINIVAITVTCH